VALNTQKKNQIKPQYPMY